MREASILVPQGEQQFLSALAKKIEGFLGSEPSPGGPLHIKHREGRCYPAPGQISLVSLANEDRQA